jgi:hypothetical protein
MLTVYAAVIGAAVSVVAVILGAVSLGLHWLNRDKHPQVQELHARCDALQLAQTDMLDRIEHWTRRDRVRRLREAPSDTAESSQSNGPVLVAQAPQSSAELKAQLRQQLRQRVQT